MLCSCKPKAGAWANWLWIQTLILATWIVRLLTWVKQGLPGNHILDLQIIIRSMTFLFLKMPDNKIPDEVLLRGRDPNRDILNPGYSSSTTVNNLQTQSRVCSGRAIWQGLTLPMDSHMAAWSASAFACRACFSSSVIAASSCCRSYS